MSSVEAPQANKGALSQLSDLKKGFFDKAGNFATKAVNDYPIITGLALAAIAITVIYFFPHIAAGTADVMQQLSFGAIAAVALGVGTFLLFSGTEEKLLERGVSQEALNKFKKAFAIVMAVGLPIIMGVAIYKMAIAPWSSGIPASGLNQILAVMGMLSTFGVLNNFSRPILGAVFGSRIETTEDQRREDANASRLQQDRQRLDEKLDDRRSVELQSVSSS